MFGLDKPVMDAVEKHSSHFYKIMKNSLKVKKEDILIISDYGADDKKMSGMLGYGYFNGEKKKGLKEKFLFRKGKKGLMFVVDSLVMIDQKQSK